MAGRASGGINVTFELVTPAYAGGAADPDVCDGLRPPALKSAIRFWWRTMHPTLNARDLLKEEEAIFGSANQRIGNRFAMRPVGAIRTPAHADAGVGERDALHTYMAFGPVSSGVRNGNRIEPGATAGFRLRCQSGTEDQIVKALWLTNLFGGYGGRVRRGWGSLAVDGVDWATCGLPDLRTAAPGQLGGSIDAGLTTVLGAPRVSLSPIRPLHTAFSSDARIAVGDGKASWELALRHAFDRFYQYRRALGARPKPRTGTRVGTGRDHVLRWGWLTVPPTPGARAPEGAAFGLPLNARFSNGSKVNIGVKPDLTGRRASPVFFKVLKVMTGNGATFLPLVLWLPSTPPSDVYVKIDQGAAVSLSDPGDDPISDFFDDPAAVRPLTDFGPPARAWTGLGWTKVW